MNEKYPKPRFSKREVACAGKVLAAIGEQDPQDVLRAETVVDNWRRAHAYPLNTFQATLRQRLSQIDTDATVAQRLKRFQSIVGKLHRFQSMRLDQMQDVGGLRAVVHDVSKVNQLASGYRRFAESGGRFHHALKSIDDYLEKPKNDGYRGIHLVYKYDNPTATAYEGLQVELQFRSRLQHAWATAVETMDLITKAPQDSSLKNGRGDSGVRDYFLNASAAFAQLERHPTPAGFEEMSESEVFSSLAKLEREHKIATKILAISQVADEIMHANGKSDDQLQLIELNFETRELKVKPYDLDHFGAASDAYLELDRRAKTGEQIDAVLVTTDDLRKAFPNYFYDTSVFVAAILKATHGLPIR